MKFTLLASAFTLSSVLASRGPKDTNKPEVVTVYRTETTQKYGRFNKTPHPTTTTVVVSPSEWTSIRDASIRSSASADDVLRVQIQKRANSTGGGAGGNSTGGGAGGSSSSSRAGVAASGATFGVAGVVALGAALLM
ncbi:uncharacterized protein LODBEIA_P55960 [Lodderomyces beijingensis]|uniref:Uncharacterized protein n=1 Tax=Lodderomyces beijingensis TaxID=1775926 RepID=A0ABP0ZWE2_9ASCO